ncbi:hypothetical protein [Streptomyces sp. UNOC14_S4]|uniref:hypothetical protein n=1 Tax=Streptomyces sp. UNOC14_S4 TaxID=2872340 RepID=UPI001E62B9EE|nr:hypothetical protein [Streptomyces sp. UNOC14_S4]MCC3772143.1 hypothetical protein [Streptomyces sp. UNOC14_S4]
MARTTTTRGASGPRRRGVLAGGAALLTGGATILLTGCSSGTGGSDERTSTGDRLRADAGRESAALLDRYDATIAAHGGLARRLAPLRAEVARHAEAFGTETAPPSPPASTSPSVSASAPALGVPGDEKAALADLARAEQRLVDTRTAALTGAPPELARLLASVAAAGAGHVFLLGEGS